MTWKLVVFVTSIAIVNVIVVLEFVRRRKLAESFALLWIGVGVLGIVLSAIRPLIDDLADTAAESVGSTRAFSLILVVPDEPAAVKILDAQTSGHITLIAASTLTLEVPQ
mgnify:CR=1 FL=1